jgi:S1-C subfamily serine protease
MKRGQFLALSMVCTLFPLSARAQSATVDLIERASASVVGVIRGEEGAAGCAAGGDNGSACGSGFVLAAQRGLVVTAAHLVSGPGPIAVIDRQGVSHHATIVRASDRTDIAILRVEGDLPAGLALATQEPRVGEQAFAIGRMNNVSDSFATVGFVSSVSFQDRPILLLSVVLPRGMSGAPILNESGEVMGLGSVVQSASTGATPPFGLAIPLTMLRRELGANTQAP